MTLLTNSVVGDDDSSYKEANGGSKTWASPWPKDDLQHLGCEAIQELAREIDKAATTIKDSNLTVRYTNYEIKGVIYYKFRNV